MLEPQDQKFIQQEIQKAIQQNQQMGGGIQNRGIFVTNSSALKQHENNIIYTPDIEYPVSWFGASSNPAIGNGTMIGRYVQRGNLLGFTIYIIAGSTTTFGTGVYSFPLPIAAVDRNIPYTNIGGYVFDNSTSTQYDVSGRIDSGLSVVYAYVNVSSGTYTTHTQLSPTIPITFAQSDIISISGSYVIV